MANATYLFITLLFVVGAQLASSQNDDHKKGLFGSIFEMGKNEFKGIKEGYIDQVFDGNPGKFFPSFNDIKKFKPKLSLGILGNNKNAVASSSSSSSYTGPDAVQHGKKTVKINVNGQTTEKTVEYR